MDQGKPFAKYVDLVGYITAVCFPINVEVYDGTAVPYRTVRIRIFLNIRRKDSYFSPYRAYGNGKPRQKLPSVETFHFLDGKNTQDPSRETRIQISKSQALD
jgi:hypothetical protein